MTAVLAIMVHALVLVVFVNRYFAGFFFKGLRGKKFDETIDGYEPTVTIVVPMFNEGAGIRRTIASLLEQRYPTAKLEVVVVDDCSTDDSYQQALLEAARSSRVRVIRNPVNMGKRRSINHAVRNSTAEIIVSVDSDVEVNDTAVAELVRRFVSPRIAAVGGRVDIRNKNVNWLTRMQTIKYFFGYEYMKTLERSFRSVMCLSGCLTAYRRTVLMELEPILETRAVCGVPIKYGEDRFLTRQIVKAGYQTTMTLDAVCRTEAPTTLSNYFSQQLRWRRSNLVDYAGGLSHAWKLHPIIAVHYFSLFALLIVYPALILQALANGSFFKLLSIHMLLITGMGVLYRFHTRHLPDEERVGPLNFLPQALVMPVTYAILTPLAMFTLDSGSWETRGHTAAEPTLEPALEPNGLELEAATTEPMPALVAIADAPKLSPRSVRRANARAA